MRAVVCRELSGPQSLTLDDLPAPRPGPGEVAIAVAAAGVNFADTLMVTGKYQEKPTLPFTPGSEIAGTVTALGAGVTNVAPGDRVIGLVDRGGFAEVALARAGEVFPIPDAMDFDIAAGFPITYGTAHGGLVWRADLKPGETLLVHGAAGGTGLAAVEVGKALGAEVIATAGGPEKLEIAGAHGAGQLIDYRNEDIRDRVKALTLEALNADPEAALSGLFEWLGVDPAYVPPSLSTRKHVTPQKLRVARGSGALERFRRSGLWDRVGPKVPRWLRKTGRRLSQREVDREAVSTAQAVEYLRPLQRPEADALAKLLGRNFDEWTTLYGPGS